MRRRGRYSSGRYVRCEGECSTEPYLSNGSNQYVIASDSRSGSPQAGSLPTARPLARSALLLSELLQSRLRAPDSHTDWGLPG